MTRYFAAPVDLRDESLAVVEDIARAHGPGVAEEARARGAVWDCGWVEIEVAADGSVTVRESEPPEDR